MSLIEKSRSLLSALRGMSALRPARRVPMLAEELEPRILHSADIGPGLLHDGFATPQAETRILDAGGEFAATAAQSQQDRTELVIVDTRTPDYQKLVDDVRSEADAGRQIEVLYLDNQRNGIDQITAMLSARQDIGALHFISHGSEGEVQLGGSVLDLQSLREHTAEIESWANALAPDADLLIYGCNVAGSPDGRTLVDALSRLTGADVAASDNLTGNAALGGDWSLEYATGRIDTALAIDAQTRQAWAGVLANSSPVLSGANNLTTITEDPATNPGTQVSALLAGHVTDANSGDPTGIAVTTVDNTSGNWQYSIDAGGTWNSFGSPSNTSARLLRSTDFVRFVPNADFNGTVSNGLTFRAWDQSSGTAGGTANTTSTTSTVRDTFDTLPVSYNDNDGTANWNAGWVDSDGSPTGGAVLISGQQLKLQNLVLAGNTTIYRSADLTGATSATLTLDYSNQILLSLLGDVTLQVSGNGGGSYTTLATFSSSANTGSGPLSFNISSFISADTRIQLVATSGITVVQSLLIDNLQISYVTPLASGVTAFSTATASSSIAITAVNDPPTGTDNTVTVAEGGTYTFGAADFGFSDSDTPADAFVGVTITTLPGAGHLELNGSAFAAGQSVAIGLLNAGKLQYVPASDANGAAYATFTFQVRDGGGGSNLDLTPRTMTIDVTAVNDPPAGTSTTVTAAEDGSHIFSTADFGFTDSTDTPANNLLAVKITTLPGAGSLTLSGIAVTAGQFVSASDIVAGNLLFTPAANANGTGYASFTFQVRDDGGGADLDATARTMTIDVTPVNDPPVGANNTVTTTEDGTYTFGIADFGFSDSGDTPANNFLAVAITTLPGAGSLTLGGVAVTAGQSILATDLIAGNLKFSPATNGNGTGYTSFTFQVEDDGGGADLDVTARTMTINVAAVNDPPAGTSNTVTATEDGSHVFSTAEFGFVDSADVPANAFLAIKIASLPGAGSLTLNGIAVTAGQSVLASDIALGNLAYSPAANANGTGYASFTFQVQDDGGGADLDPTARTMTIDVLAVNDPPTGTSNTIAATEDAAYSFGTADFGFSDPGDTPAGNLLAVKISTLPGAGSLTLSGVAVTTGQFISAADLIAGNLKFTPATNANGTGYANFTFQVQDNGGGADLDPTARTMTIDVTAVNDAPVGTSNTVTATEDGAYTFGVADFGFTDPGDTPASNLLAVKLTTLTGTGSLTLNGVAVTAGQFISAADLIAGALKFTPAANANGAGYASFTFQVQDDGGGTNLDVTARAITIDVTAVNDAPAGSSNTVTAVEDGSHVFTAADFGFLDAADTPANALLAVKITTVPGAGALTLNGLGVTAGQFIAASDIAAGKLVFAPAVGANGAGYASFTFQVQDDGSGPDLDPTARTMTIDVSAVNDAPVGTSNAVAVVEDGSYTFATTDFGFSDPGDSPANNLLAVKVSTLPGAGSLTLSGAAVTAGQFVSRVDIAAGNLKFTPAAEAYGTSYASFTFQVQDDGGGTDVDATARTMTINVTAVNDAPALAANAGVTLNEGASAVVTAASLRVTDIDSAATQLVFTVTSIPSNGHIELTSSAGVAITSFTQDDIDNNRVVYVHDDSQTTSDSFSFTVSDGAGGSIGSTAFAISITAIDDAPVNSVPAAQTTSHGAVLVFSAAGGNAISVADADAGAGTVGLSLSASNGTVTLATTAGLTFATGTGTGDVAMQFSGTVAAINAALDGMRFTPDAGFAGTAAVSMVTDDLGNSGSGGPLMATSVVNVNVASAITPPVATPVVPVVPIVDPLPVPVPPVVVATPGTPAPSMPGPNAGPDAPTFDPVPSAGGTITPDAAAEAPADAIAGSAHRASSTLASPSSRSGRAFGVSYILPATQWLLFGDDPGPGLTDATGVSFGLGVPGDGRSALQSPALMDALDRLRDGLQEQSRADALVVATTAAASLGLSVGYVLWLLRGGVLISSMLSSLPAWRLVDPLPILGRLDEDDEEADDDSLESLLAANNAPVAPPAIPVEPTNLKSLAG